jgi:hypothetical protein
MEGQFNGRLPSISRFSVLLRYWQKSSPMAVNSLLKSSNTQSDAIGGWKVPLCERMAQKDAQLFQEIGSTAKWHDTTQSSRDFSGYSIRFIASMSRWARISAAVFDVIANDMCEKVLWGVIAIYKRPLLRNKPR